MKPKDLVLLYAKEYRDRFRRSYPIVWKKDLAQAKRLLGLYSSADLGRMISLYVHAYRDQFHERAGKPFGLFISAAPALVALLASEEQSKPSASSDAEKLKKARILYEDGNGTE
jgi:hypothetical protein